MNKIGYSEKKSSKGFGDQTTLSQDTVSRRARRSVTRMDPPANYAKGGKVGRGDGVAVKGNRPASIN